MKICFVALHAYPCLIENFSKIKRIGGAEIQQVFLGKELKKRGWDVYFITLDHGQKDGEIVNGIRVFKSSKPGEGLKYIRFLYPRFTKIWKALKKANAEIYYCRGASFLPAILALFSKVYKRKFVFAGAHDTDFIPGKFIIPNWRDRLLYKIGIRRADLIIVQSEQQLTFLKHNFKLNGIVIPNFSPFPQKDVEPEQREYILWVSNIKRMKRPELFIRVAASVSSEKFIMIGGKVEGESELYKKVKKQAQNIPNLDYLEFQPVDKTEEFFDKAKIVVNTSEAEGFPNTFIQAWRRGIPVISFVDPNNMIRKYQLGKVVSSEKELKDAIIRLSHEYLNYKEKIQNFFEKILSANAIIPLYEYYFRKLISNEG